MADLVRVSPPLALDDKTKVVGVVEVRQHLRITDTSEDRILAEDIEAAYDFLSGPDGWLGRCCLLEEEFMAYASGPTQGSFEVPLRPLRSISSFGSLQVDGSYLAIDTGSYYSPEGVFGSIVRSSWQTPWPYYGQPHRRAYRMQFKAGFGTTKESIPSPIRKAIRMLVGHWYNQRETTGSEGRTVGKEVEYGLVSLCGRYRIGPDHS
jgi:uncharacterized phiE125 gp8 family phage protein